MDTPQFLLFYVLAVAASFCLCMHAFCFAAITWQQAHLAELCGGQPSTVCMEGGGRKLQKGAHAIVLPAQCDCSTLGIVRKQLHPREKLLALYLQVGNIWEGKGPKMVLVLIAKQYSVLLST